jgi:hypothetical protein
MALLASLAGVNAPGILHASVTAGPLHQGMTLALASGWIAAGTAAFVTVAFRTVLCGQGIAPEPLFAIFTMPSVRVLFAEGAIARLGMTRA